MIKAVVYDVDGTILNTISTIAGYANKALDFFGLSQLPEENYKYYVGNGARILVERMLDALGVSREEYFDKVYKHYNMLYDSSPIALTKPYDGIVELVREIEKFGIKQAVLSNKPDYATKGVVSNFFKDEFDYIYGAREGVELKPHPGALLSIIKDFGINNDECMYVGDTWVDMKTGKSAGAVTVGVLWGFRPREELEANRADYIVSEPSRILDIIKDLNNLRV